MGMFGTCQGRGLPGLWHKSYHRPRPPPPCRARPRASCSRGAAGSMSMTGRRRVQSEHSPGGLSVRLPWPPCRGLEHQASHNPPHAPPPPDAPPPQAARARWWRTLVHTRRPHEQRDATTSGDTDGPSRSGGNQKHWSGTGASGQGQARRSRVTRHALRAPPACTPRPPAPRAPHTQARRHLPPDHGVRGRSTVRQALGPDNRDSPSPVVSAQRRVLTMGQGVRHRP